MKVNFRLLAGFLIYYIEFLPIGRFLVLPEEKSAVEYANGRQKLIKTARYLFEGLFFENMLSFDLKNI